MVLRVKKADSAYLYQLLESYEGLTNFSTLDEEKASPFREIILHIAPDLREQVAILVKNLQQELEIEIVG